MTRIPIKHAAAFAAVTCTAFAVTACDPATSSEVLVDPVVAQQLVAERADPDKALAEKVKRALGTNEGAAYGVEVTATDGTVILWGKVDSTAERKRLETTTAGVVGVKALVDNITVDPGA